MLYAITDRGRYAENEAGARARLLELTAAWAASGVAFIQLREKDLTAREAVELARAMARAIGAAGRGLRATRLLVHGRPDVALAADADGVHLPAGPNALTPEEVRRIFAAAGRTQAPTISVSCHTLEEVAAACRQSPDCILFAPVFEKVVGERGGGATARPPQVLPGRGWRYCNKPAEWLGRFLYSRWAE